MKNRVLPGNDLSLLLNTLLHAVWEEMYWSHDIIEIGMFMNVVFSQVQRLDMVISAQMLALDYVCWKHGMGMCKRDKMHDLMENSINGTNVNRHNGMRICDMHLVSA